jgi:cytochrome d ubiquinol oxidase subunit II
VELTDLWFVIIAALWVGYFVLEGFDFGVGVLTRVLPRSEAERRVMINTIGPVWDGNEVWVLVAGGATSRRSRSGTPPCSAASTSRCSRSSWP